MSESEKDQAQESQPTPSENAPVKGGGEAGNRPVAASSVPTEQDSPPPKKETPKKPEPAKVDKENDPVYQSVKAENRRLRARLKDLDKRVSQWEKEPEPEAPQPVVVEAPRRTLGRMFSIRR